MKTRSTQTAVVLGLILARIGASLEGATLEVPGDHQTIQGAIDAAEAGDTVTVAAGTYHERLRMHPPDHVEERGR